MIQHYTFRFASERAALKFFAAVDANADLDNDSRMVMVEIDASDNARLAEVRDLAMSLNGKEVRPE